MCASTAAKLGTVGWFLALIVGYPALVSRYPGLFPAWLPGWFVFVGGFAGGGFVLKGLDSWRWHRLVSSIGLEPTWDSVLTVVTPVGGYTGEFEGRQVTLRHSSNQTSTFSWTTVTTPHEGRSGGVIRVRRTGLGGIPDSELPPAVGLEGEALTGQFDVYADDPALAREILRGRVGTLLVDAAAVDELEVSEDTVVSRQRGQPFDADVLRTQMAVAAAVADAVEATSE